MEYFHLHTLKFANKEGLFNCQALCPGLLSLISKLPWNIGFCLLQKRGLVLREVKCFSEVTQRASTRVRTEFVPICLQVLLALSKINHPVGICIIVRY